MASGIDVANIALAEKREISGRPLPNDVTGNKYCAWYGVSAYWCAMFVSYVCNKAGVPENIVPKFAYCPDCITWARQNGRLYSKSQVISGSYTPRPGDIFLRDGHTGIIVSVDGNKFTTVEGNTGGSGAGARTVDSHTWTFSEGNYEYIFNPDYPDKTATYTTNSLKPQREETIYVPDGLGKYYTYMNWNTITNMDTEQGRLIKTAGKNYDADGYGIVGNRYTLAMTSTFGKIGDYVDVYMSNGRIIHGIIADEKSQEYTSWDNNPANKWGHENGQCIVEWVTNWNKHDNPPSDGTVLKVINLGNYFEYPEYASGNTESYMYSENSYADEDKEPVVVWNNRVKENIQPRLTALTNIVPSNKEISIYAENYEITSYTGNLSWKNTTSEIATTMSFETPKTDAKYISNLIYTPKCGDIIRMTTDKEVFRGVVIKVDDGDKNLNKYTAVDMGWYLNKTKQTYQFTQISASEAIKQICEDLYIPLILLTELTTVVSQIYFDKTVSEIISDILSKCSGTFYYDFIPEGLRVYRQGQLTAKPQLTIASNIKTVSSIDLMGNVSHSLSIENMKNSVKVTSQQDNVYTEITILQDRSSINRYGFLQEIVKIDPEKEDANATAKEYLSENNKESEKYSFEIVENMSSYTRAGEVLKINDCDYVIESTDHSIKQGRHYNKIDVRKVIV